MTRLFTDGAELGDAQFWEFQNPVHPLLTIATIDTIPADFMGDFCYQGSWLGATRLLPGELSEFYLRYRLRTNRVYELPGDYVFSWRHGDEVMGCLTVDSLYRFTAYINGPIEETIYSDYVMQVDTWYWVEIHVLFGAISGRLEIKVDGTTIIDYTGNTDSINYVTADNLYWYNAAYINTYIDDLALNDVNGIEDNSWCGEGNIVKIYPNGDGGSSDWTNDNGDSVDNWEHVDDYPKDDDDTYVYCLGTDIGFQDKYDLSSIDCTDRDILRVYPEARIRKTFPDLLAVKLGILPSGGVDELSDSHDELFVDDYARVVGDEYIVNPADGMTWEEADLDDLIYIVEAA